VAGSAAGVGEDRVLTGCFAIQGQGSRVKGQIKTVRKKRAAKIFYDRSLALYPGVDACKKKKR
jgi:hypothetical protein